MTVDGEFVRDDLCGEHCDDDDLHVGRHCMICHGSNLTEELEIDDDTA